MSWGLFKTLEAKNLITLCICINKICVYCFVWTVLYFQIILAEIENVGRKANRRIQFKKLRFHRAFKTSFNRRESKGRNNAILYFLLNLLNIQGGKKIGSDLVWFGILRDQYIKANWCIHMKAKNKKYEK